MFDPTKPFKDLPLLPPAADLETKPVLRACIEARAALAELNQAGALLPNQAMLINTVPLLEAQSSSAIENIVTTSDRLFRFAEVARGVEIDPTTKEALRYRTALWHGVELLESRPLSTATAVGVCRELLGIDIDIRRVPGTALANESTGKLIYTPPVSEELLRELLSNWEKFLHNLLFLVDEGLLEIPVLYLSRHILSHRDAYYRSLRQVTANHNWEDWTLFMLKAVHETARWTADRIRRIRQLAEDTNSYIREELPRIYTHELAELIFVQPYSRIRNVVEAGIAQGQTAAVYLKRLAEIGVLEELQAGREKIFINLRLMHLLTQEDSGPLTFEPPVSLPARIVL